MAKRLAVISTVFAVVTGGLAFAAPTGVAGPGPATAEQPHPDRLTPEHRLATSDARLLGLADTRSGVREQQAAGTAQRIETSSRKRPVAPGVTLRSFDRYGPDAYTGEPTWMQGDSLSVDLTKGTSVDYLFPGKVAKAEPISVQANRVGAVAAVNGDFFDINRSSAPQGVGIQDGRLIQSPSITDRSWHDSAAIFTPDGLGSIGQVFFEGTIELPGSETAPLLGINKPTLSADGIAAFTPVWGEHCRCRATRNADRVAEVEVVDNHVTAVRQEAGKGPIPAGGFVLVGRGAGADRLAQLRTGDTVRIDYRARTAEGAKIHAAVNGRQLLVVNGEVQEAPRNNNIPPAPRTALGFSEDGTKMFLLTVDGRQPAFSQGVGLDELAQMMVDLGAYNAVNLDGGGSTTIVAREPGGEKALLENVPSDGHQRNDPNGLALFAPEGSGDLKGLWVETALDPQRASGSTTIGQAHTARVFPGMSRQLTTSGYDETFGPAEADPQWQSESEQHGEVDGNGVFHARTTGRTTVTARDGNVSGEIELTVLQPLTRVRTTVDQVALTEQGQSLTFGVVGYDRAGSSAPFEPGEVSLSYDRDLVEIEPDANGQFVATAKQASGSTQVQIGVRGVQTTLPLTVGLDEVVVSDFEDASAWRFFGERATGSVSSAEGKQGKGLRLTYDFTKSSNTRTGGAMPTEEVTIPGQPRALRLWVDAKGDGEWTSLQVYDGSGRLLPSFRGGYLDEAGWQQLTFPVPAGTDYPLTLRRYYSAEIRPTAQYQGNLVIDQLTALVPPPVESPDRTPTEDPVIAQDGGVEDREWQFAVMSDAQFVGRDPDSELVARARRTLREIRAQQPDFLVINGDLVDEAAPADFELAKKILDEELDGELPYYYVPGNHERADGSLDNFREAFGETQQVFDHKGTRFITFDTSGISIRNSDWTQLRKLQQELQDAAADRQVRSVVLVEHVPPRDPTPARASQLSDRKEALTIERWLAEFRRTSGKGAALIGAHVGAFSAAHVEGVPQFVNGNSAKHPSTAPDDGGFTGWSLWGVDPVTEDQVREVRKHPMRSGPRWVETEVRPHVDELTLTAPETVRVGTSASVSASVAQDDRTVPVDYPVTADWTASPRVHIGGKDGIEPDDAAWLNPDTGSLTALRPAKISIGVTVNGVHEETRVRLQPG